MIHHQLPKLGLCVVRNVESDHFHFRRDALAAAENLIGYGYLELAGLLHPPPEWVKSQTYLWVQGLFYLLSSCWDLSSVGGRWLLLTVQMLLPPVWLPEIP